MKNLILIFTLFFVSCNSDGGLDCFKKQGEVVSKPISVGEFNQISISLGIELVVSQSDEYKISVEFGKNFIDDIHFDVVDGELKITNDSKCQLIRNYHSAKVYISTPTLEKIHSGSQYSVKSDGVLRFPDLTLESGTIDDGEPVSLFEVEVDNQKLRISDNVSSTFKIKGKTHNLSIFFWGGAARFEGEQLISDEVHIYHRSSNDIIVYPISLVEGKLAGTGNLVLKNTPETVDVEQLYTGTIIYP